MSASCCCFARSSNKAIRRYRVWWRAFGAHRQSRSSGLSTLSARRNCEKLAHRSCVELVSASVNLKKITNVWLYKRVLFKKGKSGSPGLHSRSVYGCVALGVGAAVGPGNGESWNSCSQWGLHPYSPGGAHFLQFAAFTLKMERETTVALFYDM